MADQVEVVLERETDGTEEVICPWLLAADGAHSTARQQLGIDFNGSSFAKEWFLADAPLKTALAADQAHVFFLKGGAFLFMIQVVDEASKSRPGAPIWRVIGNRPDPLSQLVQAEQAGPAIWTSGFHISHRIDTKLAERAVYFAGDAAHVHSPVGARSMNLGLEDAWVFAELVRTNRLSEYDRLRRPVDQRVVRLVEFFSRMVAAESWFYQLVRRFVFPVATRIPFVRGRAEATFSGLDHELPKIAPTSEANLVLCTGSETGLVSDYRHVGPERAEAPSRNDRHSVKLGGFCPVRWQTRLRIPGYKKRAPLARNSGSSLN